MDWGDAQTWVAVGTVGVLGTSLWQIRTERKHRRDAEARRRDIERREQARLIAAYKGEEERPQEHGTSDTEGRTALYLANNSPEPVYSVVAGLVFVQGAGPHTLEEMLKLNRSQYHRFGPVAVLSILPGGLYRAWIDKTGWDRIMSGHGGVEVAFSDRAGVHWVRRASGRLEELPTSALEHLKASGLAAPYAYQVAERVALSDQG